MLFLLTVFSVLLFLALGILVGRSTKRYTAKYFNLSLIALIILSAWIGRDTHLLKIFTFDLQMSSTLQVFFLGSLAGRITPFLRKDWQ